MNITQLKQGSLSGLRRQTNECIDSAYRKGYEDGKKKLREVTNVEDTNNYQIGYKVGFEDGKKYAIDELPELANKENEIYNKALEDASELMAYITQEFIDNCYPNEKGYNLYDLNAKYGLARVLKDYKVYEEKKKAEKESIKVGDEVIITGSKNSETLGVITTLFDNNYTVICLINGSEMAKVTKNNIKLTGRHFDEVEQLLDKLKGEENDNN